MQNSFESGTHWVWLHIFKMTVTDVVLFYVFSVVTKGMQAYAAECPLPTGPGPTCKRPCCSLSCCDVNNCCKADCCPGESWFSSPTNIVTVIGVSVIAIGSVVYWIYTHRHYPKVARFLRTIGVRTDMTGPTNADDQSAPSSTQPTVTPAGQGTMFTGSYPQQHKQPEQQAFHQTSAFAGTQPSAYSNPTEPPPSYSNAYNYESNKY